MNAQRKHSSQRRKSDSDLLDKIEHFIENHIEDKIKKGLDDVEDFLKREFRELRDKARGKNGDEGPFSYIEQFLRDKKVASVAPSTKFLVNKVLKRMDLRSAQTVIEYGPAEGVITRPILERLPSDGRVVAIELNPGFVATLRQQLASEPRLTVVEGSVTEVDKIVAPLGVPPADVIVSGIPFSFLSPLERHHLLHKTVDLLRPGGRFIAYQVTTHLVPLMKYHFQDVDVDFEVRNLPPHFVFTGYK
ncbi:MAG: methyltransferase domain-containing protein [Elusimicrobia bacterium]|nr:methyltransferase domain-containing protein [Elusimicrobiota bacterium]